MVPRLFGGRATRLIPFGGNAEFTQL